MGFTPISSEIKERIISAHLSGQGRNAIDRQLKIEGAKVSHGSISNIINRYKREHEQSLQSINADFLVLASQDHGTGQPPATDSNSNITRPELRSGGPLSHLLVNDLAIHRDSDPEVNINQPNDVIINQYVKEDEFIEEEEQEQQRGPEPRLTLSDAKITSRSSYNRNGDQDQEQEQEEDWAARQPSVIENNRSEGRSRSGPKPIVDLDSDEITERGVIHFINTDREHRRREIQLINQGWQELENERHQIEQMKQSIDHRENNLKVREIKIADIEHLEPSLRQLQQMGADFFMMQSYILLVNERSVLGNIDTRQAAILLSHEFRELKNLGGILKKLQEAKQELSAFGEQKQKALTVLMSLMDKGVTENQIALLAADYWQQHQSNGNIQQPSNNNGYDSNNYSMTDYLSLNLLRGSTIDMLNKITRQ